MADPDIQPHATLPHAALPERLPPGVVRHVAATCLCLHAQRAARALARRFDAALAGFGLSNGQFSLLMALNRDSPPTIGQVAAFLAMDRTTLTAMLKPLDRRGLVRVEADAQDRRARRVAITPQGVALLTAALPVWRATHDEIDAGLGPGQPQALREGLNRLAGAPVSRPSA